MKKTCFLLLLGCALCSTANTCNAIPPDSVLHAELTPEELDAAPGYNQMKAAVLSDVRRWRELDRRVAEEGTKEAPSEISWADGVPACKKCQTLLEVYRLREDDREQTYRIDETAFMCRQESVYYYHYKGGPKKIDGWMGPYKIERKRVKPDDAPH